jgi:RNA-directed DNA polymerase
VLSSDEEPITTSQVSGFWWECQNAPRIKYESEQRTARANRHECPREERGYADDFIIQCRSQAEAQAALELVQAWVAQAGRVLHPDKTRIVDATQWGGFDFLGWHFERGYQWPREKSQAKLKERIRQYTPRNSGQAMQEIVQRLNRSLQGWRGYFNHGVRNVPERLDQMVRRRLRMLLLRRRGRRG